MVGRDLLGDDFVLAFAVVHEMPSAEAFFGEAADALKPGGLLFFAEPSGHVKGEGFQRELEAARERGWRRRAGRRCAAALRRCSGGFDPEIHAERAVSYASKMFPALSCEGPFCARRRC